MNQHAEKALDQAIIELGDLVGSLQDRVDSDRVTGDAESFALGQAWGASQALMRVKRLRDAELNEDQDRMEREHHQALSRNGL